MIRNTVWIVAIAALLMVSGCKTNRGSVVGPATGTQPAAGTEAGATTSGVDESGADAVNLDAAADGAGVAGPQGGLLSQRIVYFDFDRAEIRSDSVELVNAHAKYLAEHPQTKVRLEGHTDERGTREYNIGLGERRAQTVRRAAMLQGSAETQIATVSYGEERPVAAGSDEDAWGQNRRVEIVYLN